MADSKALYQEVILDHNKKPRNYGAMEAATHRAEGHNPLCGDHLTLTLKVEGDKLDAIAFTGESCAICKASASMMTAAVKGKAREEAETVIQEFPVGNGPYGAMSIGEPPVLVAAAAIANAVHDAVGVRIFDLPITAEKVLTALKNGVLE